MTAVRARGMEHVSEGGLGSVLLLLSLVVLSLAVLLLLVLLTVVLALVLSIKKVEAGLNLCLTTRGSSSPFILKKLPAKTKSQSQSSLVV
jgi:hypothetical protein